MKTNGTRILSIFVLIQLLLLVFSFSSFSQPDYDFSNYTRISGIDRKVGTIYRFIKVKPGVDAIVTITNLTGGVSLNEFDGTSSGFNEAFQPVLQVPGNSNGYAEFNISFVLTGTIIPVIMLEVPITPIDVDGKTSGGKKIFEYDMINWGLGLGSFIDFNLLGGELNISFDPAWLTGRNTAGIDYPGVDTMAKQAMFTVVVPSIPAIVVRVGADNQMNSSEQRLRSIYFKKFTYPYSYLAKPALNSFRGIEKDKKVELQWNLNNDSKLSSVIIEKATSANQFKSIGEVWMTNDGIDQNSFHYSDNMTSEQAYYRLKMVAPNGVISYSNILVFRSNDATAQPFKVYPSVIQSSATVNVKAGKSGPAVFQLVDYSGRVVMQQPIAMQEGDNNIVVNNLGNITTGNYVALVKTGDNKTYNQKIYKQ
jgi:hypothetical protein